MKEFNCNYFDETENEVYNMLRETTKKKLKSSIYH